MNILEAIKKLIKEGGTLRHPEYHRGEEISLIDDDHRYLLYCSCAAKDMAAYLVHIDKRALNLERFQHVPETMSLSDALSKFKDISIKSRGNARLRRTIWDTDRFISVTSIDDELVICDGRQQSAWTPTWEQISATDWIAYENNLSNLIK